jgi:hypothetical protein
MEIVKKLFFWAQTREKIFFLEHKSRLYELYRADRAQHLDLCRGEAPRDCSEVDQLYTQKLQNFEGNLNMASVSSFE